MAGPSIYDPSGLLHGRRRASAYTISDGSGPTEHGDVAVQHRRGPPAAPADRRPAGRLREGQHDRLRRVPVRVELVRRDRERSLAPGLPADPELRRRRDLRARAASTARRRPRPGARTSARPYAWRVRTTDSKGQSTATSLVSRVGTLPGEQRLDRVLARAGRPPARAGTRAARSAYVAKTGATGHADHQRTCASSRSWPPGPRAAAASTCTSMA